MSSFSLRVGDTMINLKVSSDCAASKSSVSLRCLSGHNDGDPDAVIELSNFSGTLNISRVAVAANNPNLSDETEIINNSDQCEQEAINNNSAVVSPIPPPTFDQEIMSNAEGECSNDGASDNGCSEKISQYDNATENSDPEIPLVPPPPTSDQKTARNAEDYFLESLDEVPFKIEAGVNDDVSLQAMQEFYSQTSASVGDDGQSASNLPSMDLGRARLDEVPESGATLKVSNLSQLEPFVGMRLDVRDLDFIWCGARITNVETRQSVTRGQKLIRVTINYDGWDSGWDEVNSIKHHCKNKLILP